MNTIIRSFFLLTLGVFAIGCADLKDELPAPVDAGIVVHPSAFLNPSSENFHGKAIRLAGWKMDNCQSCHGVYYDGGRAQLSCLTCHTKPGGPENCTTCHGSSNPAPPRDLSGNTSSTSRGVGAHQAHLGNTFAKAVSCNECHVVPSTLYATGHVDSHSPAEVVFNNPLASTKTNVPGTQNYSSSLPLFEPNPQFNSIQGTCSNVYCHGHFKNGNTDNVVTWTAKKECGTCHGDATKTALAEKALPKTSASGGTHPNVLTCAVCHADVVNAQLDIIAPEKHINGKLNIFGSERDF